MASPSILFILTILSLSLLTATSNAQLRENFYAKTCPRVESIVTQAVKQKVKQTFVTIPGTLRLFFHDCFVQGCDASVMIASTPNNKAEKDSQDNLSLAGDGFDTVIKAKQAVEKACPRTVSCADILALATRDVVVSAGGPWYSVELGRRDGRVSKASNCARNLPKATFNVNQLLANFNKKNLGLADLVALSAAHTLGFSHCNQFANRVYGSRPDKTLNVQYALQLKQMCPRRVDPTIAINMDPTTPRKFDNVYYKNLKQGKGLFNSDQALYTDGRTRPLVDLYASNPAAFNNAFKEAMRRMGRVGVKVGNQGEIRLDCGRIN